jgi:signal transduction histidine kinase
MARSSIQRRLIAAVVLSQLLLAIGLVWVAVFFNEHLLRRAFDTALEGRAMSIAALVRYSEEPHPKLIFESDLVPPPLERGHPDLYEIINRGHVIARSSHWDGSLPTPRDRKRQYTNFTYDKAAYRGLRLENVPVVDREPDLPNNEVLTVSYASPSDEMTRQILLAGVYTAAGSAVLLFVSVALALFGLRRGLRPLADLATAAERVSPANWELKADEAALNTTELAPLTQAMTTMLDGLHRAFRQQRDFVANAAHELKTPIAILKSTLQSLLQRPRSADEYRAGLEQALEDMERLERLLHMMLRLARAEQSPAGADGQVEVVDVVSTCRSAIHLLQPLLQERSVGVAFIGNGAMPIKASADDLRLVWSNLLENAARFSPAGGQITVSAQCDGRRARVEVEDNGPGIPADQLTRIFERFYRGDSSRARETGGYGLGLAISKALIESYGGSIRAESAIGKGTKMIVLLPLDGRE